MENDKLLINARKPEGKLGSKLLDRMNLSHEPLSIWGVSHLNVKSDSHILDIGCGGGIHLNRFSQMAYSGKICGIDYSEVSVNKSKKLNEKLINEGRVDVQKGSVSNLPYTNDRFDIVTAFETIYFWPNFSKDLEEIYRVLKPGGTFFICNEAVLDDETPENKYKHLIELLDMKIYSAEELKYYLTLTNFKDIESFRKNDWICVLASKKE